MIEGSDLTNQRVALSISDPWDFGTECGTGPFTGTIARIDDEHIVVWLDDPISYRGRALRIAVVRARHADERVGSVRSRTLAANILLFPLDLVKVTRSADTRNGVNVIGSVERLT